MKYRGTTMTDLEQIQLSFPECYIKKHELADETLFTVGSKINSEFYILKHLPIHKQNTQLQVPTTQG